jgi:NAD(P)-dependent dehydrogenase (short-subunit alcohol dehydrogenase family)
MGADKQRQSSRHHYNKQHLKPLKTMVKTTAIRQCNEKFAKENNADLVCVFAGATSGSGAGALEAMVGILHPSTFYIIGRSAAQFASQRKKLEKLNPNCKLEFLEAQVSLLSDVDEVCRQIVAAEKKVDLLFMSPGCIPFGGPRCMYIPLLDEAALIHV